MSDLRDLVPDPGDLTIEQQLQRAVRDLASMVLASSEESVTYVDRRRMSARVQQGQDGRFHVLWENADGSWQQQEGGYDNLREAVFRGYQGPH